MYHILILLIDSSNIEWMRIKFVVIMSCFAIVFCPSLSVSDLKNSMAVKCIPTKVDSIFEGKMEFLRKIFHFYSRMFLSDFERNSHV